MSELSRPDGIIFDMDGTLWDGTDAYAMGFNDFFKANNIDRSISKYNLYKHMGIEENQFLDIILPEYLPEERKKVYKDITALQYERIEMNGGLLYEGVKDGLARLALKYKLFIVSNCPKLMIEHFMASTGISNSIIDSMAYGMNYKAKHENIKYLINKYNLQSPIYIGDTDLDRKQCEMINIPFGFVSYGFGVSSKYALKFDSFMQLENYFLNGEK
jgi:phosphoglycolate phosphatase